MRKKNGFWSGLWKEVEVGLRNLALNSTLQQCLPDGAAALKWC